MKRSILFVAVAVILLHTTASPAPQQPVKARIEGVVVRAGSGTPVARARVTLTSRGGGTPLPAPTNQPQRGAVIPQKVIPPAVTDDSGKFTFQDLDEGTYALEILANGYVSLRYGQRYVAGPGRPITLTAGQDLKNLAVNLTPAGNISGRITDRSDQPLANVPMQLMRYSYDGQGQRNYQTVSSAKTNDRGEYRMYWITPGRYFLLAGSPALGANPLLALLTLIGGGDTTSANEVPVPLGYAFYPGVSDIGSAQAIDLRPGADLDAVNLTLTTRPATYRIRGRVIDSRTGQPPKGARVAASARTPGASGNSPLDQLAMEIPINNYNSSTGAFEIRDLLPGNYSVTAAAQDAPPVPAAGRGGPAQPPQTSSGSIAVAVSETDVEGVTITVAPAAILAGRISADSSQQFPAPLNQMRVQLNPRTPITAIPGGPGIGSATTAADGTFRFVNLAVGEYRVSLQTQGGVRAGPGGGAVYLKEARLEGIDVLNSSLRISGSVAGTLEVVAGLTNGQVRGTVLDSRSQPVPVAQVVLIPDRNRDRNDLYRTVSTDDNGRFSIGGIPPGEYKVFSWEAQEPFSWFDPELLAQSETKGSALRVTESSNEMIEVRFIPKEGAQ